MVQTAHVLSYLHGENPTIDATTQTYKLGEFATRLGNQNLPSPVFTLNPVYPRNSLDPTTIDSATCILQGSFKFLLMNGIPLYYALGQSTNSTPSYEQHDLTGVWSEGNDKFDLPMFKLHHEIKNGTTQVHEYQGCKVNKLILSAVKDDYITCELGIIAKKAVFSGTELTTAPTFPTGTGSSPYKFNSGTFTWDGTDYTSIVGFTFSIITQIEPVHVHRDSDEEFPKYLLERQRAVSFSLSLIIGDSVFFTELLNQVSKAFTILIERSSTDSISISLTDCKVSQVGDVFRVKGGSFLYNVFGLARKCSVTVKDSISASFYPTQS